jgi:hypothetical protein
VRVRFPWVRASQLERTERVVRQQAERIAMLTATVAAYEHGASGRPPGCGSCGHLLNQHSYEGGCRVSGCTCAEYDSGPAT